MLATQMVAPNTPQWFYTGFNWAYGIDGPPQGHSYVDYQDRQAGRAIQMPTNIRSPMPASSQGRLEDDLVNEGGIMDLWVREAHLFKYGSGTGSSFSAAARRGRKNSPAAEGHPA